MSEDHTYMFNTKNGYALVCLNCGQAYIPSLPIAVDSFLALSNNFQEAHRNHRPQPDSLTREEAESIYSQKYSPYSG